MKNQLRLAVIGADKRMSSCAKNLSKFGYSICINQSDNLSDFINNADILILPLPYVDKNGFIKSTHYTPSELIAACSSDKIIFGGCLDAQFLSECKNKGISTVDYYEREELKVLNAIPTAEGAIAIAICETDITLHGCECAVLSLGCVGRATARALHGLGANVTVVARSATALSKSESLGYKAEHISNITSALIGKRLIFNAIPDRIITDDVLSVLDKDAIIIDLASRPGGVDEEKAKARGVRVISALSLPSKYAPVTAGAYLAKTIDHILKGVE